MGRCLLMKRCEVLSSEISTIAALVFGVRFAPRGSWGCLIPRLRISQISIAMSATLWVWRAPATKSKSGRSLTSSAPLFCAMQPATPTTGKSLPKGLRSQTRCPSLPIAFCSACSRTEHVFTTATSHSFSSSVISQPRSRNCAAMFSESRSFIWQPYVLM